MRSWTAGHTPCGSPPVLGARRTSGANLPSRHCHVYSESALLVFLAILRLPCESIQKSEIRLIRKRRNKRRWRRHRLLLPPLLLPSFAPFVFCQVLLNLLVHTLMKRIARVSVELFIKVVLVSDQGLFAFPFHVLNQSTESSLDLVFAFRRLVNISDRSCHQPMPRLVYICVNSCCLAGRIPVVLPVFLWR